MTSQELSDHCDALLKKHRITVRNVALTWHSASGNFYRRDVVGPTITGPETYGVWLHEIGHIVLRHTRNWCQTHDEIQAQEVDAWRWAFRHSIVGREPLERVAGVALQSYRNDDWGRVPHKPALKWTRLLNELRRRCGVEEFPAPWGLRIA